MLNVIYLIFNQAFKLSVWRNFLLKSSKLLEVPSVRKNNNVYVKLTDA